MQSAKPKPDVAQSSSRALGWRAFGTSSIVHVGLIAGATLAVAHFAPQLLRKHGLGAERSNEPVEIAMRQRAEPELETPEPEWTMEPLQEATPQEPVPHETEFPDESAPTESVLVSTTLVEVAWWTEPLELPGFTTPRPEEVLVEDTAQQVDEAHVAEPSEPAPEPAGIPEVQPRLRSGPPPTYPALAQRRGWEGVVLCNLEIDASGNVQRASIQDSSGHKLLDDAALEAVQRWEFDPGQRNGAPGSFQVQHRVRFQLRH